MDYTPNATTGELSNDQLDDLKRQLIRVFNSQFEHDDHDQIDIRQIYQHTNGRYHRTITFSQPHSLGHYKLYVSSAAVLWLHHIVSPPCL